MIGCRFHGTCNRQRGFTLLEVLLTMCLLVLLAALAWPALEKPFAGARLRKAAGQIRAEWRTARVEAMDSGEIYFFRCAANEDDYRVECYSAAQAQENSVYGSRLGNSAGNTGSIGTVKPREESLPGGVTFVTGEIELDTRAATITSAMEQSAMTETTWSDPILFYPDGTTSTARLVLKSEHGRSIDLQLRGLTGTVSIGQVYASEELLP